MALQLLKNCLIGPRVYAVFSMNPPVYPSNSFESISDLLFTFANGFRHICTALSPLLIVIAYRNSMINFPFAVNCVKLVAIYYSFAYSLRFLGRLSNPEYRSFSDMLLQLDLQKKNSHTANLLSEYDYEIFAAPLAFEARKLHRKFVNVTDSDLPPDINPLLRPFRNFFAYICANTFGRRMVYPGATSLLQTLFFSVILENRRKLVLQKMGRRGIIGTTDGNRIDTIFFDRRHQDEKGDTLIVTCEGNAAFYETGLVNTPLSLGYSVLGWNAPGFAESSGQPTPSQILCAVDAVMQYAVNKLGFSENQIVIYAWSIGGFPATWAAANFPNIQGLILDATFDDLLPLAVSRMPTSMESLVHYTVRKHLNLPIADQLAMYKGPVSLIRRWRDELLVTMEHGSDEERRASNRANDLLKALIRSRHPHLIEGKYEKYVDKWLTADDLERTVMDSWQAPVPGLYDDLTNDRRASLIYYVCSRYLVDFDSEHNTPLDSVLFTLPIAL